MKTAKEWLEMLIEPERSQALKGLELRPISKDEKFEDLASALYGSFAWDATTEGYHYWSKIYSDIKNNIYFNSACIIETKEEYMIVTRKDLENLKREILEAINKPGTICVSNRIHIKGEEPKKEPWELYPDYRSCVDREDRGFVCYTDSSMHEFEYDFHQYICHTEKLAKRQLAELQLAKIADKWGEGIYEGLKLYAPALDTKNRLFCDEFDKDYMLSEYIIIYFKTPEQCKKSIELHQQLWKDWFMID